MKKIKYRLLLVILLVSAGIVVLYIYNKPPPDFKNIEPELYITANDLVDEFIEDEDSANLKYLGKVIEVTGKLKETEIEQDKLIITLESINGLSHVICHLNEEYYKQESIPPLGKKITIKGMCTGYLMDVVLIKSFIIKK